MLKKALAIALMSSVAAPALANDVSEEKRFSAGIASYATVVNYDTYYGSDDESFSGFALFGTAAVNNNVAFRLSWASQSHEDYSAVDLTAIEGSLLAGTGLSKTGFKAYGSVGFFSETLEEDGYSEEIDFSGLMLGGGIGYNWNPVSLEFWMNIRDTSDYEDYLPGDVVAVSGGLGLSARF